MKTEILVTLIVAVLGSTSLVSLITFLIARRDDRKSKIDKIYKQLEKLEKDTLRTQLLMLMTSYPEDIGEIMRCAEHYFDDLEGNWYLTTLFQSFLDERGITRPNWLKEDR